MSSDASGRRVGQLDHVAYRQRGHPLIRSLVRLGVEGNAILFQTLEPRIHLPTMAAICPAAER